METIFGAITQSHIRNILSKNITRVLALFMFYKTRNNPEKVSKVLSCVIYTIISNYVCNDYLACEKKIGELPVSFGGNFKHENKSYDKILGIGIPNLLMNLMSFHGFLKNINPIVVLKCPKRMLEYYFSKGFTLFYCSSNNLEKLPNEVKDRIHA